MLLALALVLSCSVADDLARADALMANLELEEARELLLLTVAAPEASEEELLRAHLLAGQIDRILEKDVDARMHFRWVLMRKPDAQLPPDVSPKIATFFELVRDEVTAPSPPARSAATPATPATPALVDAAPSEGVPLPAVLAVGAGTLALVAGGVALAGEAAFDGRTTDFSDREAGQALAVAGWSVSALAVATAAGAAVWWSVTP